LPDLLYKADNETVELYRKLRFDSEYRKEMIMRAWTKIPDFDRWKNRLDLSKHAHKITCPVTLIHGKEDVVIPSTESILMHSLMKNHNPKIHLELSNLIDHGDMKIGFSILRDIATLAKTFNHFMKHAVGG
jgi:pimeloyl-ACP methyl ester carboxylesterase